MRRITLSTSSFFILVLGIVIFGGALSIVFWKWFHFAYNALDLAIFTQAIYETTQGRFFALTIHPQSFFGDHFSPFLIIVAGFFYLLPHPLTLLGLQWLVLLSGILPIYFLSKRLPSPLWRSVMVGLYVVSPIVFNAAIFEFHELAFAGVAGLWALLFYEKKRFGLFLFFLLLSFTVREDVALLGMAFSLLAFADKRPAYWRVLPFVLGGAWLYGSLRAVAFFSSTSDYKFDIYYQWMGANPLDAVNNILANPLPLLLHLLHPNNLLFLVAVLATVGFLPLLHRRSLLFGLPLVLPYLLFHSGAGTITLFSHYPIMLLPPLFLGVVRVAQKNPHLHVPLISKLAAHEPRAVWILFFIIVGYSFLTLNPFLQSAGAIFKDTDAKAEITREAVKEVSETDAVAASFRSLPKVAAREKVYSLHYHALGHQQFSDSPYAVPDVDAVIFDSDDALTYTMQADEGKQAEVAKNLRALLLERQLNLVAIGDSVTVWKKDSPTPSISLYSQQQEAPMFNSVTSSGAVQLVGWSSEARNLDVETLGENLLPLTLVWRGAEPQQSQVMMIVEWLDENTVLASQQYPLAYGLYPPSEWGADTYIKTHHWFSPPQKKATNLRIRVVAYDGYVNFTPLRSSVRVITSFTKLMEPVTLSLEELSTP